jgi:hypothetical protein
MCAEVGRGIVLLVDGLANRRKEEVQMNYQMYFDSHPWSKQHREVKRWPNSKPHV